MLVRGGYMYHFHRENKFATVWRCTNRWCNGNIQISENPVIRILHETVHKCQPNEVKVDIIKVKNHCKEVAANTSTPMPQVYEEAFHEIKNTGYNLLNATTQFQNMSRSLYNVRNRELNVPKTHFFKYKDVIIPEKYKTSFLLFDDDREPDKIIIAFCTDTAREVIPNVETFFFRWHMFQLL